MSETQARMLDHLPLIMLPYGPIVPRDPPKQKLIKTLIHPRSREVLWRRHNLMMEVHMRSLHVRVVKFDIAKDPTDHMHLRPPVKKLMARSGIGPSAQSN